jgi:uracil-DNA glycosylase
MQIYNDLKNSIPCGWEDVFDESEHGIKNVCKHLEKDKIDYLPSSEKVFNAYRLMKPEQVKVVIIGQDPYYTPGLANGLAFSCDSKVPQCLKIIYKELERDIKGFVTPNHGNLINWSKQGVLLLNISLTAKSGTPKYKPQMWMDLISATINKLTSINRNIIWVMWGKEAQAISYLIGDNGMKLTASHPNPANSRDGFIGCSHFSKINQMLKLIGEKEIDWSL